jgi:hypothetical protein
LVHEIRDPYAVERPRETGGQSKQRTHYVVRIVDAVGAGAVGRDLGVARPREEAKSEPRPWALPPPEHVPDGNVVMAVEMMPELVADYEPTLPSRKRLQQA